MTNNIIDARLIGQSIKSLRLKNHLTQDGLAYNIGYSVRNLRRIETSGTTRIDVVNTFAKYFNVSAIDILNGCFFCFRNKKRHWRPSSYITYPNLLFTHVHARLSTRLRPLYFQYGYFYRNNGKGYITFQLSASFSRSSFSFEIVNRRSPTCTKRIFL